VKNCTGGGKDIDALDDRPDFGFIHLCVGQNHGDWPAQLLGCHFVELFFEIRIKHNPHFEGATRTARVCLVLGNGARWSGIHVGRPGAVDLTNPQAGPIRFLANPTRPMTFPAYARIVTQQIRLAYPDVAAAIAAHHATWRRGDLTMTIDARDPRRWWESFGRALVFDERHSVESAIVTAQNAVAHFT
jgi:hypothetical protein